MVADKQHNCRFVQLAQTVNEICQTIRRMLYPLQIVVKFCCTCSLIVWLVVLHCGCMQIQRFISICNQLFNLIINGIVINIRSIQVNRYGEVIFKNHGIE